MLYQFIDWRIGLFRRMMMFDVEKLLKRLRETNAGTLPYCLVRWEQLQAFAGEAGIPLPEMQAVAENIVVSEAYPSLQWVREQYEAFLRFMDNTAESRSMLIDPPLSRTPPVLVEEDTQPSTPQPSVPVTTAPSEEFDKIVEGSVSNTEKQECLEPSPPTSSPGSISIGSPNTLLTDQKRSPRQQRPLTRI